MYKNTILVSLLICFCQQTIAENNIEEVIVEGNKRNSLTEPTLDTQKLLAVPGAQGDPLSAVFSLPGVLISEDGEPAVRGSSPEDNNFIVDFLPSGNVYHAFGFSIFSEYVIGDFQLLPGAYPAQYGSATGAVFDITLRDPKAQDIEVIVDATFIRLGLMVEGEIAPGHNAYFSYRQSLLDLFLEPGEEDDGVVLTDIPSLSDYQGKYQWIMSDRDRLTFGLIGSQDDFQAEITANSPEALLDPDIVGRQTLDSRFDRQSLTWDRQMDGGADLKVALGLYQDDFQVALGGGQFLNLKSNDIALRSRYGVPVNKNHYFTVGGSLFNNQIDYAFDVKVAPCTDFDPDCLPEVADRTQDADSIDSDAYEIFIQDEWQISDKTLWTLGLNLSDDDYLQERLLEPRTSIEIRNTGDTYQRLALGVHHRTPDGEQIVPEIGNPELDNIKARHLTLSYGEDNETNWDWNIDLYYKDLFDLTVADDVLNYTNNAEGEAYGIEILLEKFKTNKNDPWYGWFSLSWSRSERTDLNTGETSVFTGDTPLVLNAVYNYRFSPRWNIGLRYTYRTGAAYTPVIGIEPNPDFPGLFRPVYGRLNSDRLPDYQRVDLRSEYQFRFFDKQAKLIVEVLNLLDNDNINSIDYEPTPTDSVNNFNLVAEKDIGFFPSIGFQVIF